MRPQKSSGAAIVAETLDLVFEEVAIDPHSPYLDKKLRETNLSKELSLIVIALQLFFSAFLLGVMEIPVSRDRVAASPVAAGRFDRPKLH